MIINIVNTIILLLSVRTYYLLLTVNLLSASVYKSLPDTSLQSLRYVLLVIKFNHGLLKSSRRGRMGSR